MAFGLALKMIFIIGIVVIIETMTMIVVMIIMAEILIMKTMVAGIAVAVGIVNFGTNKIDDDCVVGF